jgi:Domain of unknown function (DUF5615)
VTRLYLDHDVSLELARLLRIAGHDVTTAQALGLAHASDDEHLLIAFQQERVLLTHNRKDYVLLDTAWRRWPLVWGVAGPAHAGILVLDHRPERELAMVVDAFLGATPYVPPPNTLFWWRHRLGWHHQLTDRRWVLYTSPS